MNQRTSASLAFSALRGTCSGCGRQVRSAVDVQQKTYAEVTPEFFVMGAGLGKAREAMGYAVSKLKAAFAK